MAVTYFAESCKTQLKQENQVFTDIFAALLNERTISARCEVNKELT
jgi:L-fucose isomerase-like protein